MREGLHWEIRERNCGEKRSQRVRPKTGQTSWRKRNGLFENLCTLCTHQNILFGLHVAILHKTAELREQFSGVTLSTRPALTKRARTRPNTIASMSTVDLCFSVILGYTFTSRIRSYRLKGAKHNTQGMQAACAGIFSLFFVRWTCRKYYSSVIVLVILFFQLFYIIFLISIPISPTHICHNAITTSKFEVRTSGKSAYPQTISRFKDCSSFVHLDRQEKKNRVPVDGVRVRNCYS